MQIGEQCWFAENLRAEQYLNGDLISSDLGSSEWGAVSDGATATYGSSDDCTATSAFFDACDPVLALEEYGRLYNGHAIIDSRGVCPVGWGVPSDDEWMELELTLGLSLAQASQTGDRGSDEGGMLKSSYGWLNDSYGSNSSGFNGKSSGRRFDSGEFLLAGENCYWWASSANSSETLWARRLNYENDKIGRYAEGYNFQEGLSIRCIKD